MVGMTASTLGRETPPRLNRPEKAAAAPNVQASWTEFGIDAGASVVMVCDVVVVVVVLVGNLVAGPVSVTW